MFTNSVLRPLVAAGCLGLTLTACAQQADPAAQQPAKPRYRPVPLSTTPATAAPVSGEATEAAGRSPRLALTYDGGVLVLDALTSQVLADLPAKGLTRLNDAGDGRHVLLTEGDSFVALDLGSRTEPYGDHSHHYRTTPGRSAVSFATRKPGHVVVHDGSTVLYGDGNGKVEAFRSADLLAGKAPRTQVWTNPSPHHGVAVLRKDGSLVTTQGTPDKRHGVVVLDAARKQVAQNADCPGVHGEAAAADGALVFGCENGQLLVKGSVITKVPSPDAFGQIGTQVGSEKSPVVLGDYYREKDATFERPKRVALTDTRAGTLRVLELPASYSFRSLKRGPKGEGLVLGTDGTLRVIDAEAGKVTREIAVTQAWEEPTEWQKPRPTLHVQNGTAYVTEPSQRLLHLVDLDSGEVVRTTQLPRVPHEINGTTG